MDVPFILAVMLGAGWTIAELAPAAIHEHPMGRLDAGVVLAGGRHLPHPGPRVGAGSGRGRDGGIRLPVGRGVGDPLRDRVGRGASGSGPSGHRDRRSRRPLASSSTQDPPRGDSGTVLDTILEAGSGSRGDRQSRMVGRRWRSRIDDGDAGPWSIRWFHPILVASREGDARIRTVKREGDVVAMRVEIEDEMFGKRGCRSRRGPSVLARRIDRDRACW